MTVHKLSVGDGYTYLTRQVATGDHERTMGQSAADYYTTTGHPPGRWVGSGVASLDIAAGETVDESQMRNLFGSGIHPNAEAVQEDYLAKHLRPDLTATQQNRVTEAARKATKLGSKFPTYETLEPFEDRVDKRLATIEKETRRDPTTNEVAQAKQRESSRQRTSVAGYDLVFSPVKSVSLLWALHSDKGVRKEVKSAHDAAITHTLALVENHAAYTRSGTGGVAQLATTGLVATAFDHIDSRSGDPDLHTHLAVSNKVMGSDGRWRALDGSALYAIGVAASETYNSTLETELSTRLGVAFVDRAGSGRNGKPVREIEGIHPALISHFSSRRRSIEDRYAQLRAEYRRAHGHEPGPTAAYGLAQQATLETRGAKDQPSHLNEARAQWASEAAAHFKPGVLQGLTDSIHQPSPAAAISTLTDKQVNDIATKIVTEVSEHRSTWGRWNLHAETMRQLRYEHVFTSPEAFDQAGKTVLAAALDPERCIAITPPIAVAEPDLLRRPDGESVFTSHACERYTTKAILDAEDRLVAAARTPTVYSIAPSTVTARLNELDSKSSIALDEGQRKLVHAFASNDALLSVGIGPAGAGKTTAMNAYKHLLHADGRQLIGLAPSAQAAKVLAGDLGIPCQTIDKLLHDHPTTPTDETARDRPQQPDTPDPMGPDRTLPFNPGDVIVVDEASMAGTLNLDRLRNLATESGAQIRLLGDYHQLGAVAAGGALRLLAQQVGATELTDLHRFRDPAFATASLHIREGHSHGLDYFQDRKRLHGGTAEAMTDAIYTAWHHDTRKGKTSLMLASSNRIVTALNTQARADRVEAKQVKKQGVALHDGTVAGVGDWIVTRHNRSDLTYHRGKDFVRNGTTWTVTGHYRDGSLKAKTHDSKGTIRLPASYVESHVELAYASTIHRSQGITVDTAHVLLASDMNRDHLYVAATRAAETTNLYATTHQSLPLEADDRLNRPAWDPDATAAREIAENILASEPDNLSATETIDHILQHAHSLATLAPRYRHAAQVAASEHYRHTITSLLQPRLEPEEFNDIITNGIGALSHHLANAEKDGWNPTQLLTLATQRDFDTARSPAAALISRIKTITTNHTSPPPGTQPEKRDLTYYQQLLAEHYPHARFDTATALNPPQTTMPLTRANTAEAKPNIDRFHTELQGLLGAATADRIVEEKAWPALAGALERAENSGQISADALTRALAQRDLDGAHSYSEVLAWRVERQTRLVAMDPTHTGTAWPSIAWPLKAWEHTTGEDAAHLIDTLAPGRGLDNLALAIAHTASHAHQHHTHTPSATRLPWLDCPTQVMESDAVNPHLKTYLTALSDHIRARVDHVAEAATTDRPDWTHTLGPTPENPIDRDQWQQSLALAAAYRDQHTISDNDHTHPLGNYPATGNSGHHEWWAAAAALTTHTSTQPHTGLAPSVEHELAHAIAVDLYHDLPPQQRQQLHTDLQPSTPITNHDHLDTAICHPTNTQALLTALAHHGHLSPHLAASLNITTPHLHDEATKDQPTTAPSFLVEPHPVIPNSPDKQPNIRP